MNDCQNHPVLEALLTRRSVRKYLSKPLDPQALEAAVKLVESGLGDL